MLCRDRTRSAPAVNQGQPQLVYKEKWNAPRANIGKVAATYWCFLLLGSNDSSYGVLIPHLETFYNVSYLHISLIFLSPVAGFIISTLSNHAVHVRVGQRGVVVIAGACQLLAYAIACLHPPFYALVLVYALVGLGCGSKQAAWNSWIGSLDNTNELLGLLHGFYGLGATITPLIASTLFAKYGWKWYMYYYVLAGMAAVDIIFSLSAFGRQSGKAYKEIHSIEFENRHLSMRQSLQGGEEAKQTLVARVSASLSSLKQSQTGQCLRTKVVLLCSCYLLSYVGSEVALGSWLVTFMIKVRHGTTLASGITTSGLWAGITLGRMGLGFVTGRFFNSEKHAVTIYLIVAMIMELLFWLIPSFLASAITVAVLGFFLGPLFPGVIICISKHLPRHMQVPAIGICSAIGASGASVVPFMVGAIAQAKGVEVLQPIIFALLVLCLIIWLLMPPLPRRE